MKTRNIIAMLIVCLFVGTSTSTFATEKQDRDIPYAFSKVLVDDGINLYFSQGNASTVSLEAEAAILDKVETVVQDETLIIRMKKGEKLKRNTVIAHVTVSDISEIKADKKSNVYLQTPIHSDSHMSIYMHNGSSITCGAINAKELNIKVSNASKAKLATVISKSFTLNVAEFGDVQNGDINTDFASVNLYNNSTAYISVNATNLVSSANKGSNLIIGGTTNNITANASGESSIKGNNLKFDKSTVKSLDSSSIKLAQK